MVAATLGRGAAGASAFVLASLLAVSAEFASAQLSTDDIERIKAAAARQGTLQSQRIPATGRFEGCDLQFVHTVRDVHTKKGELVKYAGAFRASYASGKAPRLHLQVKGADLFVASDGQVSETPFVPAAVTLGLGPVIFKAGPPVKGAACEEGAACAVVDFTDFESVMAMSQAVIDETLSMHVTASKGAEATELRPADIEPAAKSGPEFAKFMTCFSELLRHVPDQN